MKFGRKGFISRGCRVSGPVAPLSYVRLLTACSDSNGQLYNGTRRRFTRQRAKSESQRTSRDSWTIDEWCARRHIRLSMHARRIFRRDRLHGFSRIIPVGIVGGVVFFSIDSIQSRAHVSRRISSIFTSGTTYTCNIKRVRTTRRLLFYSYFSPPPYTMTSRIRAILFLTGFSSLFFFMQKNLSSQR